MGISNFLVPFMEETILSQLFRFVTKLLSKNVLTETHWLVCAKHDYKGVYFLHSLLNSTCSIWILLGLGYKQFWNSFVIGLEVELRVIRFGKQKKTRQLQRCFPTAVSVTTNCTALCDETLMLYFFRFHLRASLMIIVFYTFWLAYLFVEVSFWIFP